MPADRRSEQTVSAGSPSAANGHDRDTCDEARGVSSCCNRGDFVRVVSSAVVLTAAVASSARGASATAPHVGGTALESDYLADGDNTPPSPEFQRSSSLDAALSDEDSNEDDR